MSFTHCGHIFLGRRGIEPIERRLNRHYQSINRTTKRDVANTITEKTHFKKNHSFVRNTVSWCKKATESATNTSNHYRNESNITSDAINDRTRLFDTFITPVFLPSFYRSTFTTEFFYLLHDFLNFAVVTLLPRNKYTTRSIIKIHARYKIILTVDRERRNARHSHSARFPCSTGSCGAHRYAKLPRSTLASPLSLWLPPLL